MRLSERGAGHVVAAQYIRVVVMAVKEEQEGGRKRQTKRRRHKEGSGGNGRGDHSESKSKDPTQGSNLSLLQVRPMHQRHQHCQDVC